MEYSSKTPSVASINYLNPRESLQHIRRLSEDSTSEVKTVNNDRQWRLSYLKTQFRSFNLDRLYKRYTQRIHHGYFSLFLILQIVLSITHFLVVFIPNLEKDTINVVLPDLILYGLITVLPIIGLGITDGFVKQHPCLLNIISAAAFFVLFFVNFFIPMYHGLSNDLRLIPAYTTYLILSCYIFFNIYNNLIACLLGFLVTFTHIIVTSTITYAPEPPPEIAKRVCSDFVYLLCINVLGVYFRYMNEIVKRRGFLDRRGCVESTLKLKYEKEQEEQLMLSIIPKHILVEVRKDLLSTIEYIEKTDRLPRQKPFENPYINAYDNVSILYADIVNYTEMTTKLKPVTKLVETLNELFGRFDNASEELKVLRIKFLGDCYYCVAGLPPDPAPNHAEACVDLGLKMIEIIREVRDRKNLEIDMRIGVHSGKILSGLIGLLKWQFDVWSTDVDIANRMETTGVPGKVHISKQTKSLLRKDYNITPSDKGNTDVYLKSHSIETYIISPMERPETFIQPSTPPTATTPVFTIPETSEESFIVQNIRRYQMELKNGFPEDKQREEPSPRRDTVYMRRASSKPIVDKRRSGMATSPNYVNRKSAERSERGTGDRRPTPGEVQRRTAFMDNNINKYQERLRNSDICMQKAIETMPLSKYEQWFTMNEIHPFLLMFRNLRTEMKYIQLPDALFKYYLLAEILILISVVIIQNLTMTEWAWSAWLCYGTIAFIAVVLLPLTWTQSIWSKYFDKYRTNAPPTNPVLRFFYMQSGKVAASLTMRISIYFVVCSLFVSGVFTELVECSKLKEFRLEGEEDPEPVLIWFVPISVPFKLDEYKCSIPWHMSETAALAVFMSFSFLRIHMWLKFLFGTIITLFYATCVWIFGDEFYEGSETINYMVKPRSAHIVIMVFLTFTLHLIDRQADYMHRLDFQWNEQIVQEQKTANTMHKINNILLNNILPIHVADIYLNVNRQSTVELYHEEYSNVAVMFASIVDFEVPDNFNENFVLKIMNQIIGDFDKILGRVEGKPIEKIKVAKWTYMAACGLDPGRRDSDSDNSSKTDVVLTLLQFAVSIMEQIKKIGDREMFSNSMKLRIGIAHGELTAGVIGSKKPLYDIWGNPVNMASRMDSTGLPGKIQIPEATAKIIESRGIQCEFRDNIKVKGISGLVPTYFVNLEDAAKLAYDL